MALLDWSIFSYCSQQGEHDGDQLQNDTVPRDCDGVALRMDDPGVGCTGEWPTVCSNCLFAFACCARWKLTVEGVEVSYGPGAASPVHSHPCPVIGYVLSGAIRTQVKGQPEAVYKAGESFYEPPNGVHLVSANASDAEPAKLLAFFLCDHAGELSTAVKGDAK